MSTLQIASLGNSRILVVPTLSADHDFNIWAVDCGDYVIVTNPRMVNVTGRKEEQLVYRKHTMYPGGLKETRYRDSGMLSMNKLRERRVERLRIFRDLIYMGILQANILKSWEGGTHL